MLMSDYPDVGDIMLTRMPGKYLGRRILWYTRARGERPSRAGHAGVFADEATVQEALARGVVRTRWTARREQIEQDGGEWAIYTRQRPIMPYQRPILAQLLKRHLGAKYAWGELPLCALDGLLGKLLGREPIFFRRLGALLPGTVICSKLVGLVLRSLGWVPPACEWWTPDDLADYLDAGHGWQIRIASENW